MQVNQILPTIKVPISQGKINRQVDAINIAAANQGVITIESLNALKDTLDEAISYIGSDKRYNYASNRYIDLRNLVIDLLNQFLPPVPQFNLTTKERVQELFGEEDLPYPDDQVNYVLTYLNTVINIINQTLNLSESQLASLRNQAAIRSRSSILSYLSYTINIALALLPQPNIDFTTGRLISNLINKILPFTYHNDLIFIYHGKYVYYPPLHGFVEVEDPRIIEYLHRNKFFQIGQINLNSPEEYVLYDIKQVGRVLESLYFTAIKPETLIGVAPLALSIFRRIIELKSSFEFVRIRFITTSYTESEKSHTVVESHGLMYKTFNLSTFKTRNYGLLTPEDIANDFLEREAGYVEDVYKYDEPQSGTSQLDLTWYEIGRVNRVMGAGGCKRDANRMVHNYRVTDYKCEDGNCLIAIFNNVSKIKNPHGYSKKLREHLKLEPAPVPIPIEKIDELCVMHQLNCKVFTMDKGNEVIIRQRFIDKSFMNVEILWEPETLHFSRIIERFVVSKEDPDALESTKINKETLLVCFDYETVFELKSDCGLCGYQLGWLSFSPDRTDSDFSEEEVIISSSSVINGAPKKFITNSSGEMVALPANQCVDKYYEPTEKFIEWLLKKSKYYKCVLFGFNNAKFDNWLLAKGAADKRLLKDIFMTGNQLRDVVILNHHAFDLSHIIPGRSLSAACKDFKTSPIKVDGYDHMMIQEEYNNGKLREWYQQNKEKADHYLRCDVRSTASLFVKLREALKEHDGIDILEGVGNKTIGGIAWNGLLSYWQKEMLRRDNLEANVTNNKAAKKHVKSLLPIAKNKEDDDFFRKAMYGGRAQLFCPKGTTIEGKIRMVDAKSLYPTVCVGQNKNLMPEPLYGMFPITNEYIETTTYISDKIGVYYCRVIKQPLKAVIPIRREPLPLNWTPDEEFDCVLLSPDINCIRRHGGEVVVGNGVYWEKMTYEFFNGFFEGHINEKNRQDNLKTNGDISYNPSMRETRKLIMNSLTGKFSQRNFNEHHVLTKGIKETMSLLEKCKSSQFIGTNKEGYILFREEFDDTVQKFQSNVDPSEVEIKGNVGLNEAMHPFSGRPSFTNFGEGYILFSGEKPADKIYDPKKAKPAIWSALIYCYARLYMYELLISKYNALIMDTDSYLFSNEEDYHKFRAEYPILNPDNHNNEAVLGDFEEELHIKESGLAIAIAPKDYCIKYDGQVKARVKGINPKDIVLYTKEVPEYTNEQMFNIFKSPSEVGFKYCNDPMKFFEMQRDQDVVYVLCSQITKSLKQEKGFSLDQRYLIKEVK
jgi:hypothetical protein